ncbi:MAG: RagB/SusD family nutrient uptake outer membrane protein [Prevotellaceae bacterium]|nr:RagB/SusD family nutrient uptake outer membrane protein [Prevotellaceae bacterium]
MNNILKTIFLTVGLLYCTSCTNYLEVVPDNVLTVEDIFSTRKDAIQALANAYSYLPHYDATHSTPLMLGDEYIGSSALNYDDNEEKLRAIRIMRNLQVTGEPILGYWSGTGGVKSLYQGINQTNIFLENIDNVVDIDETTKKDWTAQVKFLKAYYHFLLVQHYGPIVLSDHVISPGETDEELLFPKRRKIEECFDFIINLLNEAIPDLRGVTTETDYGQVNKSVATAMKARILVARARPFFNGNRDIFGDFYDADGQHFFPQQESQEKWQDAVTAINEAIATCTANGFGIYKYPLTKTFMNGDTADLKIAPERIQVLYDLRYMPVDPWNNEIIWGYSNLEQFSWYDNYERWLDIQTASTPKVPPKPIYSGEGEFESKGNVFGSGNWLASSYRMEERFYTENGLPIDEDLSFDAVNKYELVTTPGVEDPEYKDIAGIIQPGIQTVKMHLNRELRFYTTLAVPGSYFRAQRYRINAIMLYGQDCGRGIGQRSEECFYITGIGLQKLTHPQSSGGWSFRTIYFPYPIIRMADLYLMKAEALNELSGPSQEVYDALNVVRRRAGIPDVEKVWSDPTLARTLNKHTDQLGLREIILQERGIELAFEGSRYWDMVGYKKAVSEFSSPIVGWNDRGSTPQTFYTIESKQYRRFTPTNYLWPIDLNEMNINANLIQNPGW